MSQWLTDDEQRAWRGLVQMTSRLDARLNRELQQSSGLSLADYDVLVLLTEAPTGGCGCSSSSTTCSGSRAGCPTTSPACSAAAWSPARSAPATSAAPSSC